MRTALINSPERVWSKRTRAAQLLQPEANSLEEWNQLEDEVHLKLGGENVVVAVVIIISPYYRAVGCFKMGKHKFTDEIAQRKRQKAKHKLKFTPNAKPPITYVGSVPSSPA